MIDDGEDIPFGEWIDLRPIGFRDDVDPVAALDQAKEEAADSLRESRGFFLCTLEVLEDPISGEKVIDGVRIQTGGDAGREAIRALLVASYDTARGYVKRMDDADADDS